MGIKVSKNAYTPENVPDYQHLASEYVNLHIIVVILNIAIVINIIRNCFTQTS
jgi:hypothetical protein